MSETQLELPIDDPEPQPEHVEPEPVPMTRVEQIAAAHGWKPNGKDDALTFLEKVPNYREGLTSKLQAHEQEIQKLYDALALKMKADHAQAQIQREAELREATRVGDEERALRIAQQMREPVPLPERPQVQQPVPDNVPPIVHEWAQRNEWIMTDQVKASEAQALYEVELRARGGVDNPAEILPRVEAKMRKLYSQEVGQNPNRNLGAPTSPSAARPSAVRRTTLDNLSAAERRAVEQYREMGLSEEKIAASLKKWETRRG